MLVNVLLKDAMPFLRTLKVYFSPLVAPHVNVTLSLLVAVVLDTFIHAFSGLPITLNALMQLLLLPLKMPD